MTANFALSPDQVRGAVEIAIKNNPVYADMLNFYGRLFVLQEESKSRLRIDPLNIPADLRAVKAREKFPLIDIQDFAYDKAESADLFVAIGRLAKASNPKLAASIEVILNSVGTRVKPSRLFSALLTGNEALFEDISTELGIEKQVLGFITYNSLKPSLCRVASQLAAYLQKDEPWSKGYCPICGSAPILSILENTGKRGLICSFCWHQWALSRVICPFCDNADNKGLHYLYSEEEKELRVDLCDRCNKYLKTFDTRQTDRLIYPPLEHVSTLHLDIKAKEDGFEPGVVLFMEE